MVLDWNILIIAIAGFISVQVPIIIGIIKLIAEYRYSRRRQYHIINQNDKLLEVQKEHKLPLSKNDKEF
jgi:hypothetical protein